MEAKYADQSKHHVLDSPRQDGKMTMLGNSKRMLYDDLLAELEWQSKYVDDSIPMDGEYLHNLQLISGMEPFSNNKHQLKLENHRDYDQSPPIESDHIGEGERSTGANTYHPHCLTAMLRPKLPGKKRCKRSRRLAKRKTTTTRTKRELSSSSSSEHSVVTTVSTVGERGEGTKNAAAKAAVDKKEKVRANVIDGGEEGRIQKCLHCETDETPQWRTGPKGPKTLCNACGVRYTSGRLVPEYRPAASPTFVPTKHSNSHKKVLELRKQKEMENAHRAQQSVDLFMKLKEEYHI